MKSIHIILFLSIFTFNWAFSQNQAPTATDIRQAIEGEIYSFKIPPVEVPKIENIAVWNGSDSVKVRLYFPDKSKINHPIIYQIHGGALVAGDLNTHDNICRLMAMKTTSIVVAIDYRKPPESPYPASLDDCVTVLKWIQKTASSWYGDINNLTLLGDSGGGLLINSLTVKEKGSIPIKKIVLINPAVDLRNPGDQMYGLVTQMYLNGKSANDALISPILATDVSFLPTTLIITCEKDLLKAHGTAWNNKLQKANVSVKLIDIPNEDHLGGLWAVCHPKAKQAIDETIKFILQ
jgi:acetyl esterase